METSSHYFECASCCQQVHVDSKMLLRQNPPVLNYGCWLTQVVLYNGHKTAVVVVIIFSRQRKRVVVIQNLSRVYGCGYLSCNIFFRILIDLFIENFLLSLMAEECRKSSGIMAK